MTSPAEPIRFGNVCAIARYLPAEPLDESFWRPKNRGIIYFSRTKLAE